MECQDCNGLEVQINELEKEIGQLKQFEDNIIQSLREEIAQLKEHMINVNQRNNQYRERVAELKADLECAEKSFQSGIRVIGKWQDRWIEFDKWINTDLNIYKGDILGKMKELEADKRDWIEKAMAIPSPTFEIVIDGKVFPNMIMQSKTPDEIKFEMRQEK